MSDLTASRSEIPKILRILADNIEKSNVSEIEMEEGAFEALYHNHAVYSIEYGGVYGPPVDLQYWGTTFMVHLGPPSLKPKMVRSLQDPLRSDFT